LLSLWFFDAEPHSKLAAPADTLGCAFVNACLIVASVWVYAPVAVAGAASFISILLSGSTVRQAEHRQRDR